MCSTIYETNVETDEHSPDQHKTDLKKRYVIRDGYEDSAYDSDNIPLLRNEDFLNQPMTVRMCFITYIKIGTYDDIVKNTCSNHMQKF